MSADPPPSARTRSAVAAASVAVGAACVAGLVVTGGSPPAAGEDPDTVVVDETFGSGRAERLFSTSGTGTWQVRGGDYVLRTGRDDAHRRSDSAPLSVLRSTVRSSAWTLEVTAQPGRGSRGEYSVVFWHSNRANYSYVHVDRRPAKSGIYQISKGRTSRLAPLDARVAPGEAQRLEIRRDGAQVKVYVGGVRTAPAHVGSAELPGPAFLHAGLGSWGGPVRFDDLRVAVPGEPTLAPTGPTSPSSVTATPTTTGTPTPSSPPPTATSTPTATTPTATSTPTATPPAGGRTVSVATSEQLTAALADARPGDVITMADGVYTTKGVAAGLEIGGKHYYGTFVAESSGTATLPIVLQGSRDAVIDGKPGEVGTGTQYGLYLAGVDHWSVTGITVTNVTKGIVLDQSNHNRITGVAVHTTGQEGIHLRAFSSDNLVDHNVVRDTGTKNATYGEGIYVGSANSNWGTYSGGLPDRSDRNQLIGNDVRDTGAENMDIKEGTTGGLISGNTFDGAAMTGSWADSWIDLKGNGWLVEGNHGTNALEDGFQVHQALSGWGNDNVFRDNVAQVNGPGYGFWLQKEVTGTRILCANTVTGAAKGFASAACVAG